MTSAVEVADVGSGAGLPGLVLALALPHSRVTVIESQRKKCAFIEKGIAVLKVDNVRIHCGRVEDYGSLSGREIYDVAVSRALAALPVVAEYSVPLLRPDGAMVAMKGSISDQERIQGLEALGILGAQGFDAIRLYPFPGAKNRWVYVAKKSRHTPAGYPRRPGIPAKRPLGSCELGG